MSLSLYPLGNGLWLSIVTNHRGVHPNPVVPGRLRDDTDHEGHQQEVLRALLPEPGSDRRGREALFQTAGTSDTSAR